MKYAIIQRPSVSTIHMIRHRVSDHDIQEQLKDGTVEAVGICQGSVLEVLVASDVAEKAANVMTGEIHGSCPQHMTCLVVFGDTAAVREAVNAVKSAVAAL